MPAPHDSKSPPGACPHEHLVSPYLDGELSPERLASFEAHLAGCEPCARAIRETQRLSGILARASVPAIPPGLLDGLHAIPSTERDRGMIRTAFALTSVAAALLVAGSAWLWLGGSAARTSLDWELAATASDTPAADGDDRDLLLAAWVVRDLSRGRPR